MARLRNASLAARINELGLTEMEFADAVNDALEQLNGERGRLTDRYVRKALAGELAWPRRHTRLAVETVLGRSAVALGFTPPVGFSAVPSELPRSLEGPLMSEEEGVDRREALGVVGGIIVSVAIPALPVRGRLGLSDTQRLREPLRQLIAIDDRLGGVALANAAARQAERVGLAIGRYQLSDRVERAMYALMGEYLATAGWLSVDADELDQASQHLNEALRAASIARDPLLQAQIWNYMAMRARQGHNHAEAHAVAKAGLAATASRQNPRVAALFNARVAHGHAFRGELGLAERSLGRAYSALGRTTPDTDTPPWLMFVDEAHLAALSSIAYLALNRYPQAEAHAREDLRLLPTGYGRNRVHGVLHLAQAHLGQQRVGAAVEDAHKALDLSGGIVGGLHAGRVAGRLRRLRAQLAQWSKTSAANAWVARYDAELAK